jgi:LysM repeat protein
MGPGRHPTIRPPRRSAGLAGPLALACALLLALASAACGGGVDEGSEAARNPTDPRRVPTATIPAQRGTPIAALDLGQARPASLPETYVVKAGDTLGVIAADLGITVEALVAANPNIDPRGLRIGQELRVPRPSPSPTPANVARGPATPTRTPTATATGAPGRSPTPTATPARTPTATPQAGTAAATATRTPTPTAAPTATPSAGGQTYVVQAGDTACAIARRFSVSLTALAQANGLSLDQLASLRVGQELRIPPSTGESPGC